MRTELHQLRWWVLFNRLEAVHCGDLWRQRWALAAWQGRLLARGCHRQPCLRQCRRQPERQLLKDKLAKRTFVVGDFPASLHETPPRKVVRGPTAFRATAATRRDRVWQNTWHERAVMVAWASIVERAAALRKAVRLPTPCEIEMLGKIVRAWALNCYLECNNTMAAFVVPRSNSLCAPANHMANHMVTMDAAALVVPRSNSLHAPASHMVTMDAALGGLRRSKSTTEIPTSWWCNGGMVQSSHMSMGHLHGLLRSSSSCGSMPTMRQHLA